MNAEVILDVVLPIAGALTLIAAPFALGFLTVWLRTKVGGEKLSKLLAIVQETVLAAEGLFPQDGSGASKKAYVMKVLRWAANDVIGMGVDDEFLSTLVESAVYWLFNREKKSASSAIEPAPATVAYKGK
ncbi:MAG: hypothetical protein IT327_02625 [Anaerolineae bacterium]|nr:hypothetical protein [Anaerolineae bacterium]